MNRDDLVEVVAEKHSIAKTQARELVDTVFDTIKTEVKKGREVKVAGFGIFERTKRKARTGRNPQTGEPVEIPASNVPKFRAGTGFKELVNQ